MPVSVTVIKNEITYDLTTFGLALKNHNIPSNPPNEIYTFEVPGRAGKIRQGVQVKERSFTLEFIIVADDPTIDYHIKVAAIGELLDNSVGPMYWIFGDIPGKRYLGEYNGTTDIEKIIFDGYLTVPLVCCFPYPETVTDVTNGWSYGQGYTYGMGLRYGDVYTKVVTASPTNFIIYHAGNVLLPPKIKITGQFTNLNINDGRGNILILTRVNGALDVVDIDCENFTIFLNTSTNIYSQGNGVFFTLPKGETNFTVTASGTINFTIQFTPFRHRYIY